jgi:hypothetical protein
MHPVQLVVRVTGLEPAQPCDHKNLNQKNALFRENKIFNQAAFAKDLKHLLRNNFE